MHTKEEIRSIIHTTFYEGLTSKQKGDLLERAVKDIESMLIERQLISSSAKLTIIPNFKYQNTGAPREVDIYIQVEDGQQKSIFIYECKNRENITKPIDVVYFQRKMDECKAQRGYFIAQSFTSGCYDEAASDCRLELVTFSDNFLDSSNLMNVTYGDFISKVNVLLLLKNDAGEILPADPTILYQVPDGRMVDYDSFLKAAFSLDQVILGQIESIKQNNQLGVTNVHMFKEMDIVAPDYLEFKGHSIRSLRIEVKFDYYYAVGKIVSYFDLDKKARHIVREIEYHTGEKIEIVGIL